MQEELLKRRMGMLEDVGLPLLIFISRHTKVTIFVLKFLSLLIGRTKRTGRLPFAMVGKFCFKVDKYFIRFWVNPIGKSDESRYLLLIETQSNPHNVAYKNLAFA